MGSKRRGQGEGSIYRRRSDGKWVRQHLPGTVADTTEECYRDLVERHIVPVIGSIRLDRLSPQDVPLPSREHAMLSQVCSLGRLARPSRWRLVTP